MCLKHIEMLALFASVVPCPTAGGARPSPSRPARAPALIWARAPARSPTGAARLPAAPPLLPRPRRRPAARPLRASALPDVVPSSVESSRHALQDGSSLEVLMQRAVEAGEPSQRPPLVFVHGSYHGAWCWAVHFLPYFAARGYDTYAISLRGHGLSDRPDAKVAGTLRSHTEDLADFVGSLPAPPVVMAHSFAGLFVMNYFARAAEFPPLAGGGVLASTPPSGNSSMIGRFLKRDFVKSLKLTYSMVAKGFEKSTALCRESFFSEGMPDAEVVAYQNVLKSQSGVRLLDLKELPKELPVPRPAPGAPPMLVLGAADDFLVDEEGVRESAAHYGTSAVILPDLAHDVMLDVGWERAAGAVEKFLEKI